jgi:serine O-acetyltransferase
MATDLVNRLFATQWHALRLYRTADKLWRRGHRQSASLLLQIGRIISGIEIVPGARIGANTVFVHGHGIVIGAGSVIGEHCTIFQQVTVGTDDGDTYPVIGNNVTLYPGAKVIGPVHIGDGAKIGANAVVLQDIPAGATAVGVPAVIVNKP